MYNTDSHIAIASEYGCDVYSKSLEKIIKNNIVQRYDLAFVEYINKKPFLMLWNSKKDAMKTLLRLVTRI